MLERWGQGDALPPSSHIEETTHAHEPRRTIVRPCGKRFFMGIPHSDYCSDCNWHGYSNSRGEIFQRTMDFLYRSGYIAGKYLCPDCPGIHNGLWYPAHDQLRPWRDLYDRGV